MCEGSRISLLLLVTSVVSGCGASFTSTAHRIERLRRADSCVTIPPDARESTAPRVDADALDELPPEVRRVAAAAGIRGSATTRRADVERVVLLQSEVSAAHAEVECLSDHTEDLERNFEERRSGYELSFTLASIAVGALSGVASAVLDLTTESFDAGAWTEIVGGVLATVLGLCAFFPPDENIDLDHSRNVLRGVWTGATDDVLPRFVTRLLSAPRADGTSPRDRLRADWLDITRSRPSSRIRLFGDGGAYGAEDLALRELVLETLETEIALESQELELLLRTLVATDP